MSVCELGSRDVNGSARSLFSAARLYVGVDLIAGPGVDVVADAVDWHNGRLFDVVVSTEMLEHTFRAAEVCRNAHCLLRPGGMFVLTAAGPGREPHSAQGGDLLPGEFYANVHPENVWAWLDRFPVRLVQVRRKGMPPCFVDVYALARKGD